MLNRLTRVISFEPLPQTSIRVAALQELFRRFPTPEGSTWGHEAGRRLWMALAYMRGRVVWVREVPKDCQNSGKVKVNSIWRHSRS